MKKMKSMRVAAVLLALVMITSCFVGNTFAKYTTSGGGKASARVAKFGVVVGADASDVFLTDYAIDATSASITGSYSVSSSNDDCVVAPGTKSNAIKFSISGTPEVAVNVAVKFDDTNLKDIFLKKGEYTNDTTADLTDSYSLGADYYPVVFTLKQNNTAVDGVTTLQDVVNFFQDSTKGLNGDYDPNTVLKDKFGDFELSWVWAINGNDQADTLLGNLAAGMEGAIDKGYAGAAPVAPTTTGGDYTYESLTKDTDYCLDISFDFSIVVTQID